MSTEILLKKQKNWESADESEDADADADATDQEWPLLTRRREKDKRRSRGSPDDTDEGRSPVAAALEVKRDVSDEAPIEEEDDSQYFSDPLGSTYFRRFTSAKTTARGRRWKKQLRTKGLTTTSTVNRVSAICLGHSFDLSVLLNALSGRLKEVAPNHLLKMKIPPIMHDDAIRLRFNVTERDVDLFYFSYGCLVAWGFSEEEEKAEIDWIAAHKDIIDDPIEVEQDTLTFRYAERTTMVRDIISLERVDDAEQMSLMKLAVSFGLAQSVKLEVFESQIDQVVQRTQFIPRDLAKKGDIIADKLELSKMTGEIMLQRNRVHLQHDFFDADVPDFFWEGQYENLEPVFRQTRQYFEICKRADAINRRLDVLKEVFEMVSANLNIKHSTILEYVVIWLIVLECVLTLFEFFFSHYVWGSP